MASSDTPKHWGAYLKHLNAKFDKDMQEWEADHVMLDAEYDKRPWYLKIMQTKEDVLMWHEMDKPSKSWGYKPELIDYYNWTVKEKLV